MARKIQYLCNMEIKMCIRDRQYVDSNFRLVIGGSRECFALLARNSRIGVNQLGHYTTHEMCIRDRNRPGAVRLELPPLLFSVF